MRPPRSAPFLPLLIVAAFATLIIPLCSVAQENKSTASPQDSSAKKQKSAKPAVPHPPSPEEELQSAIDSAANDRAALLRNLEAYLAKYPDSPRRPQIYRALVEASLQLRHNAKAATYAERIVALSPEDMSITLLAIELLEKEGDEAALRRAVNYSTRVLDFVEKSSIAEKSPRVSTEEWEREKIRDRTTVLLLRGRLALKLRDTAAAQKDFLASYAIAPNAAAAEKLGELAEASKNWDAAITEYARAFALADSPNGPAGQHELRRKLGNVWRLVHGSDGGLGEFLLRTYDEASTASTPRVGRNADAHEPYDFSLRMAPSGNPYPLADKKGKILVVNFWATWCGPCRALEPAFERVASQFSGNPGVLFLEANTDEDESLVPPYLDEVKPKSVVVFADGLDRLFAVNSFPTVIIIDAVGKIAYRAEGFSEDTFETELSMAVNRALAARVVPK